jgi:periplasmic protein TonB
MFETSLIDIQKSQSRRTPGVLATSAGLHVAIFAAALSAAYWNIGPVAEPMENAVFIMQASLPSPPPSSGTRVRTETAPPKPVAPVQETVQPKAEEIAEDIPKAAETEAPSAPSDVLTTLVASGGPATAGGPGFGDGPDSGFDGPGHGSEIPGPGVVSDQPYKLTAAIARPVLLTRVEPVYPEVARRSRQGGTVILQTVIDESGRVIDVTVVKGLGFGLQQAAIDAVSKWRFQPATMNGRAVKVFFNLTVQFSLS